MSDVDLAALKSELAELAASMKPKHLQIAKALVDGKSQEAAYVAAGYKGKNPNSDANNLITTNPSISKYVDLVKEIAALAALPKQIATFEQKRQMLWDVAQKCFEERHEKWEGRGEFAEMVGYIFDSRGVIAAIAELNKMDGDLAAIKTDNAHSFVEELTDEQLDKHIAQLQAETAARTTS
jgi:isoaspartyl peptidase/L-asparaginase-like protein (Ntn-hydrolase superfamily)